MITLLSILIIAIIITACLIILPGPGSDISSFYSNWTINISVIIATGLSSLTTVTAYRTYKSLIIGKFDYKIKSKDGSEPIQYTSHKKPRKFHFFTCLSLTIGLVLWTAAELGWTYYQLGLGIENPFPSIADGFWLAGYAGIILFVFGINNTIFKSGFRDREAVILVSVSAGLSLGYVFNLTFGIANIVASSENELGWLVSILYPIFDTIVLIPCLIIIASIPGGEKKIIHSLHWLLLTSSIIIVTIADIGFDYSEVLGISDEQEWFWDILYAASYIVMAGALYSYYKMLSRSNVLNQQVGVPGPLESG
jgi:hypothetical protein